MVERKVVIEGLKIKYNGIFEIDEFYKIVEDWINRQGREMEIKKKLQHVTPQGINIEFFIECWKMIGEYSKSVVRMHALFKNVKEVKIKKKGYLKKYNKGDAFILLDGYIETLYEGRWTQRPMVAFIRTLFDRYIYKYWTEKFDTQLKKDTTDLYRQLTAFFSLYKYHQ